MKITFLRLRLDYIALEKEKNKIKKLGEYHDTLCVCVGWVLRLSPCSFCLGNPCQCSNEIQTRSYVIFFSSVALI